MASFADPGAVDLGLVGIQLKCGVNLEATCRDLIAAVEALRVREVDLAGALEELVNIVDGLVEDRICPHRVDSFTLDPARTVLAGKTEALERARAVEANSYAAGLAMAAIVADQHRGAAAKARLAKGNPLGKMDDDGLVVEIRAEERGEDIAAEIISKAIRALGKEKKEDA